MRVQLVFFDEGYHARAPAGIVPMLVRMSDELVQEFTINFHRYLPRPFLSSTLFRTGI